MRRHSILAVVAWGLAALCLVAGSVQAQSEVIFSTFENPDYTLGWPIGWGMAQGDQFQFGGEQSYYLVGIELPVTMLAVPVDVEQLTVSLCRDAGGQPGEVLESFSFGGMSEGDSGILKGTSQSHPLLDPGSLYWFIVSGPSDGLVWWADSNPVVSGLHKYYYGISWYSTRYNEMGAFRIIGSVNDPGSVPDVLTVGIDIKPGSSQNTFNIRGGGVIPVAILGSENFDVTSVDIDTVEFAGLPVHVKGNGEPQCTLRDVNHDGNLDLVCQFVDNLKEWPVGQTDATLTGYEAGTPFTGTDTINIVP